MTVLGLGVAVLALTFALTAVHTIRAFESDPSLGGMRDGDLMAFPSQDLAGAELRRFSPTVEPTRYILKVNPEADPQAVLAALKVASGGVLKIGEIELPEALTSLPRPLASPPSARLIAPGGRAWWASCGMSGRYCGKPVDGQAISLRFSLNRKASFSRCAGV